MDRPEPRGWLVVDKPAGMTSHDVVARLRRATGYRRFGHSGTLDPDATGVLVLAVGAATRLIQYLEEGKSYRGVVRLGVTTDSQDASGAVLVERPVDVTEAQVREVLKAFTGPIRQRPPMVSAVHHQGRRLYELAREGIEVADRPEREVTIHELALVDITLPDLTLDVACSGGTYIRTLAHDLGERLGCGAHLLSLRRTMANGIGIAQARPLDELVAAGPAALDGLLPPQALLAHLPEVHLPENLARRLRQGQQVPFPGGPGRVQVVFGPGNELIAVAEQRGDLLAPRTVMPG